MEYNSTIKRRTADTKDNTACPKNSGRAREARDTEGWALWDRTATEASKLAKSISDDRDDQTGYFSQQNTKQVTFSLQVLTSKGHEVTSGVSTF